MIDLDKELELRVMAMTSVYNSLSCNVNGVQPTKGWSFLADESIKSGNGIVDAAIKKTLRVEDV